MRDPVAGVSVGPGSLTDGTGCTTVETSAGLAISATLNGNIMDGVDIIDQVLLMEQVFAISQLGPYQLLAADLTNDGVVTTFDVVRMRQIINGEFTVDPVWRFYDADFTIPEPLNPFADPIPESITVGSFPLFYNFVAVKMGDLDFSFELENAAAPALEVFVDDEALNNGEAYDIFLYADKTLVIQGIQWCMYIQYNLVHHH